MQAGVYLPGWRGGGGRGPYHALASYPTGHLSSSYTAVHIAFQHVPVSLCPIPCHLTCPDFKISDPPLVAKR